MVIFGFDPGSISFGVGILKKEDNRLSYVHSEVIALKEETFFQKMIHLWLRLRELYGLYPVTHAAIEEGFLGKNTRSMDMLAKVRGVVLASLIEREVYLDSYSPREIKRALTGSGGADKTQVAVMIGRLLNLQRETRLSEDESDALAVAFCHSMSLK